MELRSNGGKGAYPARLTWFVIEESGQEGRVDASYVEQLQSQMHDHMKYDIATVITIMRRFLRMTPLQCARQDDVIDFTAETGLHTRVTTSTARHS